MSLSPIIGPSLDFDYNVILNNMALLWQIAIKFNVVVMPWHHYYCQGLHYNDNVMAMTSAYWIMAQALRRGRQPDVGHGRATAPETGLWNSVHRLMVFPTRFSITEILVLVGSAILPTPAVPSSTKISC